MPHSILMMHHPSGASRGQASDMHIEARELVRVRDYLSLIISDSTGQPYDRVSESEGDTGQAGWSAGACGSLCRFLVAYPSIWEV